MPELPNYDIRLDKTDGAVRAVFGFREAEGPSASLLASRRDAVARAVRTLRSARNDLTIEFAREIGIPEVISPDVWRAKTKGLLPPRPGGRAETLRAFVESHDALFGIEPWQAENLRVLADYENPSGNMGFAVLEQRIHGIPVFQGEVKAGFRSDGSLFRVINRLAPAIDESGVSTDFGDPTDAVLAALEHIALVSRRSELQIDAQRSNALKAVFGEGDYATVAEKVYFPIDFGVARPAWKVLLWQPVNAFYVVVDAKTGTLLWRKNLTEDQTQSATFQVYRNANAFLDVADSPAPLTPGPTSPGDGTQGALLARENVALIGNEGLLSFNNLGWITDGTDVTDGNAVQAGLDLDFTNGVDAPVSGASRVFSSAWNPPPGDPAPGDAPTVQAARDGAVIQMFYVTNRYHDVMYQLGFTEPAFNFQNDNFGRGGLQNDRISAEGQDRSGTNNANFSTPADGARGRMQMYVFTYAEPDRDGTADADVLIHELTHGLSNRLHGNATGLGSDMARGMGEGWSDFYAHSLLAEPTDPLDGIYTTGGYVTLNQSGIGTANFYYGIRSLPKAILSSTGGPSSLPYNPLTFADIDPAQADNSDGAFPARFGPNFGSPHFRGEVWSSALWEVRALMIQRLGFEDGTTKVLQVVTDGMKLAPSNPTFLQERDAILAAAYAGSALLGVSADVQDIWEGFRIRGMGFSARVDNESTVAVTEAFDLPNAFVDEPGFLVSDQPGDDDSYPEPGESLSVTIPLKNLTGSLLTGVTVSINGGPAASFGDIPDGSTVTEQVGYVVPPSAVCGDVFDLSLSISSNRGTRVEVRKLILGAPADVVGEDFDGVTAPALPAGWATAQTGAGVPFVTTLSSPSSAPNSAFTPNTGNAGGNTGATLDSVEHAIQIAGGIVRFQNRYDTESGWDGGVLEISLDAGPWVDILSAGGFFRQGGYNGGLGTNSNPLDGRAAWTGDSGGYVTSQAVLPPDAKGKNVRFRWRFGEDTNTSSVGWNIDDVSVTRDAACDFVPSDVFADDFESADTCAWSSRAGSLDACPP